MRKAIYILIVFVAIGAVYVKARIIAKKDSRTIVSFSAEWKKHGKPVDVVTAVATRVPEILKVSGVVRSKRIIDAEVPPYQARRLSSGQMFIIPGIPGDGDGIAGRVQSVSSLRDVSTGLHAVRLLAREDLTRNAIVIARVGVGMLTGGVMVPSDAVITSMDKNICWRVQDGKARVVEVSLGKIVNGKAQIFSGLSRGDLVCVSGLAVLEDGDLVRIRHERKGI